MQAGGPRGMLTNKTDAIHWASVLEQDDTEASTARVLRARSINTKEYDSVLYGPMVDYSYRSLDSLHDALKLTPRPGLRPNEYTEDQKLKSCSFRLSHNKLNDLSGLEQLINTVLVEPSRLFWIDLSFNNFLRIDPVLILCTNLQVLNFHGNQVGELFEADKLASLPHLRSLTLHGNPVELQKGYRSYIVGIIPQLKSLDYSTITKQDRSTAAVLKSFTKQKRPAQRRYHE
ncbi:leucine rich repeat containing 51 [Hypanus sabinus]|uniref:leucine rich repeat containing 51 n=1 Tax=Hypanus sabinus TaxID=79690 RepID=UPI0028C4BCDA|nr:leucine rich repeat containing 51 [Hypanus sabinus]